MVTSSLFVPSNVVHSVKVNNLFLARSKNSPAFSDEKAAASAVSLLMQEVLQTGMNQLPRKIMKKSPWKKQKKTAPPSASVQSICSSISVPFFVPDEKNRASLYSGQMESWLQCCGCACVLGGADKKVHVLWLDVRGCINWIPTNADPLKVILYHCYHVRSRSTYCHFMFEFLCAEFDARRLLSHSSAKKGEVSLSGF